ncbi:MAG TPA: tRNA (adenosine(37)-N6)-dimethylallyltransferase MiaA [Thermoleophilia bacterium]|nr:tRNA (adenosine(37)-N6)-dimethylallyltransferase MiaA [Thermoleophilia bacterium]
MSATEGPHNRPNDLARSLLRHPLGGEAADGGLVIAILGPTGVGKTEVAARVALELGVRVISCDSMQIYRGFPVLTNQPGEAGAAGSVRHELVAVAEPQEEWSAAAYARRAQALIDEDIAATGWAVISGGTGLYMRAALAPLAMARPCDPERRAALERLAANEGPERMHERLAAAAPEVAEKIHPHNVRRVVRALEVIEAGGAEGWSERRDLWRPEYRHPTLVVVLAVDRTVLYERIERRAREMVRSGAVEEVERHRALQSRAGAPPPSGSGGPAEVASTLGAPASPPRGVERAIGYRELAAYLDGRISRDEAIASLAAATRRYARRQVTWVRKLGDADIIDTSERSPQETSAEVLQEAYALRRIPPTEPDVG